MGCALRTLLLGGYECLEAMGQMRMSEHQQRLMVHMALEAIEVDIKVFFALQIALRRGSFKVLRDTVTLKVRRIQDEFDIA